MPLSPGIAQPTLTISLGRPRGRPDRCAWWSARIAQEAQSAGLLSQGALEKWLREQLKMRHVDELFAAMDRMAAIDAPTAMSPEEVAEEIAAIRAERRGKPER